MKRVKKVLSANETLELLNKQWCSLKDIALIGSVGLNKAGDIKREIQDMIIKKGKRCPPNFVPTELVVDYFGININYLKKISLKK